MGMGVVPGISNMGLGGKYDTYMRFFTQQGRPE